MPINSATAIPAAWATLWYRPYARTPTMIAPTGIQTDPRNIAAASSSGLRLSCLRAETCSVISPVKITTAAASSHPSARWRPDNGRSSRTTAATRATPMTTPSTGRRMRSEANSVRSSLSSSITFPARFHRSRSFMAHPPAWPAQITSLWWRADHAGRAAPVSPAPATGRALPHACRAGLRAVTPARWRGCSPLPQARRSSGGSPRPCGRASAEKTRVLSGPQLRSCAGTLRTGPCVKFIRHPGLGKPGSTPAGPHPCGSQDREVALQLELGDLVAVLAPLLALVAQEEVEDMLAERLGHQLAALHDRDRLVQALRQGVDA